MSRPPVLLDGWWDLDEDAETGYWYLWAMPTRVKVLRVGGPGTLMIWDKKAKGERPLTIDELINFWCETRTR